MKPIPLDVDGAPEPSGAAMSAKPNNKSRNTIKGG